MMTASESSGPKSRAGLGQPLGPVWDEGRGSPVPHSPPPAPVPPPPSPPPLCVSAVALAGSKDAPTASPWVGTRAITMARKRDAGASVSASAKESGAGSGAMAR